MSSEIQVKVTKYADRKNWVMYYDDPASGKRIPKSTGKATEREARSVAAKWEAELQEGRYKPDSNISWADFRSRFLEEHAGELTDNGYAAFVTALNAFERHVKLKRLADLIAGRLEYAKAQWEKEKLSKETVRSYLSHLCAAMNWAVKRNLLGKPVAIEMPKRVKGAKRMKGRSISTEEYERMLEKVEAGLVLASQRRGGKKRKPSEERIRQLSEAAAAAAPSWGYFLRALWWSGLRLSEALTLSWDDERFITVDMSGPMPRLVIAEGQDKGQEERLLPLAPEFAEMLLAVPVEERTGRVFRLVGLSGEPVTDTVYASAVISRIGEAANVVVDRKSGKMASAHDLRRAFGTRWAMRLPEPVALMRLMRHADITTTMRYYADADVASTEEAIYRAFSRVNTFVNNQQNQPENEKTREA